MLPTFTAKSYTVTEGNGRRRRLLKVKCPRGGCGKVFMVHPNWKNTRIGRHLSAGCPHCGKWAYKPGQRERS